MKKNLVFICGHRKSGTSLFHSLFDGHKDLIVYPIDLNLFYLYFPHFIKKNITLERKKIRLQKILFDDLEFQLNQINIKVNFDINKYSSIFFKLLKNEDLNQIDKILKALIEAYLMVLDVQKKIIVFKETSLEIYFEEIKKWFPESKFIQLVRDPRDNFASIKSGVENYYSKIGEDNNHSLSSLIYRVRLGLGLGFLYNKIYSKNFVSIRFEDLVKSPKNIMNKICEFLEIDFHDNLLIPTKLGQPFTGNSFENNIFHEISSKNVNSWRKRIDDKEAIIIEFFLENEIKCFKYELFYDKTQNIKVISDFYKWENYKYYFNDRIL